jgi:hypothetical protein
MKNLLYWNIMLVTVSIVVQTNKLSEKKKVQSIWQVNMAAQFVHVFTQ